MNIEKQYHDFRQSIISTPKQFRDGLKLKATLPLKDNFQKIILTGMGGSALPGEILQLILSYLLTKEKNYAKISLQLNRFYDLPPESYEQNTLNIICSYSGNTEETINALEEGIRNKLPTIGMSGGGKVEEICLKNNIPHIKIPKPFPLFQPRMAIGYFLFAILQIMIKEKKIADITNEIMEASENLEKIIPELEKQGYDLAEKIFGKVPLIYVPEKFRALGMIWKIRFNENCKIPAFYNTIPEFNHNELAGFTDNQPGFSAIIIKDPDDNKSNLKRYPLINKTLNNKDIKTIPIDILSGNIFFKLFSSIVLADWMTYYLALKYQKNPGPVEIIEKFKKDL